MNGSDTGVAKPDRRAVRAAYKERKREAGIYAIRCVPTGAEWVGAAADLRTIQNRRWFTLARGTETDRALQAAWKAHGADAFTLEVLERLDPELTGPVAGMELRDRLVHWRRAFADKA